MSEFFERRIRGTIGDVQARLEAALKERRFGVMHVHDVKGILESKGVQLDTPVFILDVCNPQYAKQALELTGNRIAPLLPCSIALHQDGQEVVVRFLSPLVLARFFPDVKPLAAVADEVRVQLEAAVAGL